MPVFDQGPVDVRPSPTLEAIRTVSPLMLDVMRARRDREQRAQDQKNTDREHKLAERKTSQVDRQLEQGDARIDLDRRGAALDEAKMDLDLRDFEESARQASWERGQKASVGSIELARVFGGKPSDYPVGDDGKFMIPEGATLQTEFDKKLRDATQLFGGDGDSARRYLLDLEMAGLNLTKAQTDKAMAAAAKYNAEAAAAGSGLQAIKSADGSNYMKQFAAATVLGDKYGLKFTGGDIQGVRPDGETMAIRPRGTGTGKPTEASWWGRDPRLNPVFDPATLAKEAGFLMAQAPGLSHEQAIQMSLHGRFPEYGQFDLSAVMIEGLRPEDQGGGDIHGPLLEELKPFIDQAQVNYIALVNTEQAMGRKGYMFGELLRMVDAADAETEGNIFGPTSELKPGESDGPEMTKDGPSPLGAIETLEQQRDAYFDSVGFDPANPDDNPYAEVESPGAGLAPVEKGSMNFNTAVDKVVGGIEGGAIWFSDFTKDLFNAKKKSGEE